LHPYRRIGYCTEIIFMIFSTNGYEVRGRGTIIPILQTGACGSIFVSE
jgi:hypothetical protein